MTDWEPALDDETGATGIAFIGLLCRVIWLACAPFRLLRGRSNRDEECNHNGLKS